jgi:hypothetical protein
MKRRKATATAQWTTDFHEPFLQLVHRFLNSGLR